MPSTEAKRDYILRIIGGNDISWRKMMGEYLLYRGDILFGGVYDDRLLVKATPAGRACMPMLPLQLPYPGAKPMLYVSDETISDEVIRNFIDITCVALSRKYS